MIARLYRFWFLGCWIACCSGVARSDTMHWQSTTGGVFSASGNWVGSVAPSMGDRAYFGPDAAGVFTVSFTNSTTTVRDFYFRFSPVALNVTFNLGGHTVLATGDGVAEAVYMTSSVTGNGPYALTLTNGLFQAGGRVNIGHYGTAGDDAVTSVLRVSDGATLRTLRGVVVGNAGTQRARIDVTEGGRWESYVDQAGNDNTYWLLLGNSPDCHGTLCVTGTDAIVNLHPEDVTVPQALVVGDRGVGVVEVTDGGQLIGAGQTALARIHEDAEGTVLVTGAGSVFETRTLVVGGNRTFNQSTTWKAYGTGRLRILDGAAATVTGTGNSYFYRGAVEIDNGLLSLNGPLFWMEACEYRLSLNTPGTVPLTLQSNLVLENSAVTLEIALGASFSAQPGDEFVVLDCAGTRQGTFAGLAQGDTIALDDYVFQIDYGTPTNGRIVLNVVAVPAKGPITCVR